MEEYLSVDEYRKLAEYRRLAEFRRISDTRMRRLPSNDSLTGSSQWSEDTEEEEARWYQEFQNQ